LWLRAVLVAFTALFLVAIFGAVYQAVSFRGATQRFPHPGKLVSAGGFRLNVFCAGQGLPTVLLEAGLADSLDSWRRVQPEIAQFARVCSYDRAGYGYSDPGPMPRTADRIASEVHEALRSAGEKPPYVLVGHSFGGFLVRVFNGRYSGEVAGIVLVDSTQEDQYRLLPQAWASLSAATRQRARRQAFWAPIYIDLGLARLELLLKGQDVPPVLLQSKYLKARTSELVNIEVSAQQARVAGHIADKPLVVLTGGNVIDSGLKAALNEKEQRAYDDIWVGVLQTRLVRLSSRARRTVLPDSGHDIPLDRPDAIVTAVRELSANIK
jgi:pimeloyl-ACP methyl ester carboxylesterase